MFRVDFSYDDDAFAAILQRKLRDFGSDKANDVADRGKVIAEGIADRELSSSRPTFRRADGGGGRRYHKSFIVRPSTNGGPASLGNASEAANIIENGSRPHSIDGNPKVAFPDTGARGGQSEASNFGFGKASNVFGRGRAVVVNHVDHPGTRAYKIIQRAIVQALREKGVRAKRVSGVGVIPSGGPPA